MQLLRDGPMAPHDRSVSLAAHHVDRDDRVLKHQHLWEFRDRRDLVALGLDDNLAEADRVGRTPSAHHMNGRSAAGHIEAASERLAVDRNHLSAW